MSTVSKRFVHACDLDENRIIGAPLDDLIAKDKTEYSTMKLQYKYPCNKCRMSLECKTCGADCVSCMSIVENCKKCSLDNDVRCKICTKKLEICTMCENFKLHGDTLDDLVVKYSDVSSKYGISFSAGEKYIGKASLGVDLDYSKEADRINFGDSTYAPDSGTGAVTKIRHAVIREFEIHGGIKYPTRRDEPIPADELSDDMKSFAAHLRIPPSAARIAADKTGKLAKKNKAFQKYFKIKYHFSDIKKDNVSPADVKKEEIKLRQRTEGLLNNEVPYDTYTYMKVFTPVVKDGKVTFPEYKTYTNLAKKSLNVDLYVSYPSLYVGNTYSISETINQIRINTVEKCDFGSRLIDNDEAISNVELNTEQSKALMATLDNEALDIVPTMSARDALDDDKEDDTSAIFMGLDPTS